MRIVNQECVHELFEAQVGRVPLAVAVAQEKRKLTYAELNRRANQLAHYLRGLGVRPETRVGICTERNLEMMVGLLAVLKAGGAYVPMDPAYPAERLQYMLEDSAPLVLLTEDHLRGTLPVVSQRTMVLDLGNDIAWREQPQVNLERETVGLRPDHLAYVIYTSGSTGKPKGVMIEHRNLSNYLRWSDRAYYQQPGGGSPAVHSIGFDGLVTTLFGPLVAGQTLTLLPQGSEMECLAQLCSSGSLVHTLIKVTPSHLKLFNELIAADGNCAPTATLMIG
ncbi:MAG: AMP-binding protein, partial [Acidobacteriia bacterium]|nr:AMP-binding protein [Terriglobia bacterium]